MIFRTPGGVAFEIPDAWWEFADMPDFKPAGDYYPYSLCATGVEVVPLADIAPLARNPGVALFEKCRLVPVLLGFQSRFCDLPPIGLHPNGEGPFRFRIYNGCHRFYASVAAGYTHIPAIVFEPFV